MSLLWIILIVVLVLVLLGFFGRGRYYNLRRGRRKPPSWTYAARFESASVITTPGTIASASTVFCSNASGWSRAARARSSRSVTPVSTITGGLRDPPVQPRSVS